jgi:ArsR family transcriptional regulator
MELSNLAKIFKALSNEQRLRIFLLLYKMSTAGNKKEQCTGCCCHAIEKSFSRACEKLEISRSTVSHHFKELESCGLISCTRSGRTFVCRINEDAIESIRKFI